jgi:acyl-CoA dehydrogenase
MSTSEVLSRLLAGDAPIGASTVREFLVAANERTATLTSEADRALGGGAASDRLGYAFAAGYQAALRALLGERAGVATCLAATEAGGAQPRAILTSLVDAGDDRLLVGEKQWTTLAEESERMLVFCRDGEVDGRPRIRAVLLPTQRAGITIERMPDVPFAPEVHHAKVTFAGVRLEPDELLPGDAYTELLKPFRTVEDAHVLCAVIGHLIAVARRYGSDRVWIERLSALALTVRSVATSDPGSAAIHIALGGSFAALDAILAGLTPSLEKAPEEFRSRFERDKPLLRVASKAREARLARAWETLVR